MKAIVYRGSGGVEAIAIENRPDPVPGPGQILVRVRAAGLNRADLIQRKGAYPAPPGWPADVPGLEYAGEVEALGPGVGRWRAGDRVMGLVGGGAQAELLAVNEAEAMPVLASADDAAAAAIPEAFLTAYDALALRAGVVPGERVLIHAVGSGVGTAAVQLVSWLGGVSIGTSRTPGKLERAKALGLAEAIDTGAGGFGQALGAPVDVILDFFGGGALAENLAALAPRGRLVLLGTLQGGTASAVDLGRVLRGRLSIIGSVMRSRGPEEREPLVEEFSRRALPAFAGTTPALRPVVGATFPMAEVAEAHRAMEANEVFGKIVLTV
ncbi:MAG: NAD(P)H-quinone oxidoreductase [Gemmatimonadales bacterium]